MDFTFASGLLVKYGYNAVVTTMAWVAFLTGILGAILFIVKFMLMRKAYCLIIELKQKRDNLNYQKNRDEVKKLVLNIRRKEAYLGFYDLLCAAIEDVPQLTITLLFGVYTGWEDSWAVANLAFSLATLFWCPIAIFVGWCGCTDDPLHGNNNEDENNNNHNEMVPMTSDNDQSEGQQNIVSNNSAEAGAGGLPPGWRMAYTQDGRVYFVNDITQQTQWNHPGSTQSTQNMYQ